MFVYTLRRNAECRAVFRAPPAMFVVWTFLVWNSKQRAPTCAFTGVEPFEDLIGPPHFFDGQRLSSRRIRPFNGEIRYHPQGHVMAPGNSAFRLALSARNTAGFILGAAGRGATIREPENYKSVSPGQSRRGQTPTGGLCSMPPTTKRSRRDSAKIPMPLAGSTSTGLEGSLVIPPSQEGRSR